MEIVKIAPPALPPIPSLADIRVLLVEDSRYVRTLLRGMLRGFDCRMVSEAEDGAEALKLIPSVFISAHLDVSRCERNPRPEEAGHYVARIAYQERNQFQSCRDLP